MTTPTKKLRPQQTRFLQELLKDPSNQTAAAEHAGVNKGQSASNRAHAWMQMPHVVREWQRMQRAFALQCEIKANDVVRELQLTAFSDIRDFVEWGPNGVTIRDPDDLPTPEMTRCIKQIKIVTHPVNGGTYTTITLHDKLAALHKLGLHLGMWDNGGRAGDDPPPPASEPLTEDDEFALLERYAQLIEKRKGANKRLGYDREGEPINIRR